MIQVKATLPAATAGATIACDSSDNPPREVNGSVAPGFPSDDINPVGTAPYTLIFTGLVMPSVRPARITVPDGATVCLKIEKSGSGFRFSATEIKSGGSCEQ